MLKNYAVRRFASLVIVSFILSIAPSHAQLGPKNSGTFEPTNLGRVKVGDSAPDFTLENLDGRQISLSDFLGKKNVVLVFYRGHW